MEFDAERCNHVRSVCFAETESWSLTSIDIDIDIDIVFSGIYIVGTNFFYLFSLKI